MVLTLLFHFLLLLLLQVNAAELGASVDDCKMTKCKKNEPPIRFPFWLKDRQPHHCGYPGFALSCTEKNQTVLEHPHAVKLVVKHIDYKAQGIQLYDPDGCLPRQLPNLNISASPFQFRDDPYDYLLNGSFFNCSSQDMPLFSQFYRISCLSIPRYQVILVTYMHSTLLNCSKISDISDTPQQLFYVQKGYAHLKWSKPLCSNCEVQGKRCRLKNNSTRDETECFDIQKKHKGGWVKLIVAGVILSICVVAFIVIGMYCMHQSNKREEESQVKIEKFLEDYRALKPSRYSYADIKRITNQFNDKIGEGGYGTVFKGRLSNDVLVAVKVLNSFKGDGEEFINEVGSMGRIHHVNVTRLVGFCADGYKRALIYEYLPNESLEKFIYAKDEGNRFLSWEKLQDIALGIAKGIEYLHQGCEQRILHFDIKPHNILLDENFNPKISDFGLAKLCSKEQSAVSMTTARGTMGYIAPEVLSRNFGNVSYKSDVYSFGMLLLEMVGGRKNIDVTVEKTSQVYFPEWVYSRLEKGEDLVITIENERQARIAEKLTIVGLWCIQWYPADRPSMKTVVKMLEGESEKLTIPPNPFASTDGGKTYAPIPKTTVKQELSVIYELE